MKIRKRDGRVVNFDQVKIDIVLDKATADFPELNNGELVKLKTDVIKAAIEEAEQHQDRDDLFSVEDCQNVIIQCLRKLGYRKVANNFQKVREERAVDREMRAVFEILTNEDTKEKTDNANVDGYTMSGRHLHISEDINKIHSARHLYNKKIMNAVNEGIIYIHDRGWASLGSLTCIQIDIPKLFKEGFSTGHGWIREPSKIGTALTLVAIAIQSSQNDFHGGQSVPNYDFSMAPYVMKSFRRHLVTQLRLANSFINLNIGPLKDVEALIKNPGFITEFNYEHAFNKLNEQFNLDLWPIIINNSLDATREDTWQASEAFVHNLNHLASRAGAQVPFSSINFGMDTSDAGRLVTECLLKAQMSGLGKHETPIFPILIYVLKKGINFNPGDPNYDLFRLAMECSSKRLFPTYAFVDSSFNLPFYERDPYYGIINTMGCRTRVMSNINGREGAIGRGNLSFNSINLPLIALNSGGNLTRFYRQLEDALELADEAILKRLEIQSVQQKRNLPFMAGQGLWLDTDKLDWYDEMRDVLKHGTLSLGFVGLAEALVVLTGKHHGESKDSDKLGYQIVKFMKDYCDRRLKETKQNYSLLATPAETYCYTALKQAKEKYGLIEGVTDKDYFTNSSHIPVGFKIGIKEKIKIEGKYHKLENAGHICYVEVDGDISQNLDAFEEILRTMSDADIGYGAINIPLIWCPNCHGNFRGSSDIHVCPSCGYDELEDVEVAHCDMNNVSEEE